jgi:hypothetical protein
VPLSSARQNKESEKGLFNTNKQKTNTRTYVTSLSGAYKREVRDNREKW